MKESSVNTDKPFMPSNQAAEIREQGKSSINFPPFSTPPEFPAILHFCLNPVFSIWYNQISLKFIESSGKPVTVINFRYTSSQTPCSFRSLRRLQPVDGLGYRSVWSCHRALVHGTQRRMPSKSMRFSAEDRPPLEFCFGFGSSGSHIFHLPSFMKLVSLAIGQFITAYCTKTRKRYSCVTYC